MAGGDGEESGEADGSRPSTPTRQVQVEKEEKLSQLQIIMKKEQLVG